MSDTGCHPASTSPNAWAAYAHYVHFLGMPERVYELPDPKPPFGRRTKLDVAVWCPMGKGSVALVATAGGSDKCMSDATFAELFMLVRPAPDEQTAATLGRLLKQLMQSTFKTCVPLSAGRRLLLEGQPAPLDRFAGALLLPPMTFAPEFRTIRFKDGKTVQLLWVVPLFQQELDWCAVHGSQALHNALAEQEVDLAILTRAPARL